MAAAAGPLISDASAAGVGEAELLAPSPVPLTSVAVDPNTDLIYALEYEGRKAFSYNPVTNAWTELPEAPESSGNNGGAVYLDGQIFADSAETEEPDAPLEAFNIETKEWSEIPNPLGEGTANITAVGQELYMVIGTQFVKYNPITKTTTTLANAPEFTEADCGPGFQGWGGLEPYQGKIYGDQGDGCQGFAVYDIATDSWTELPDTPLEPAGEGPVAGSAFDPVTGTYFAYGGYGGTTLFQYDTAAESWSFSQLPFEVNDGGMAYVESPGHVGIYAIQGQNGDEFVRFVTEAPSADLAVAMTASSPAVNVGGELTYTIRVKDGGPNDAEGVTITDALPSGLAIVSASTSQGRCSGTTVVSCALGTVANQATATVTIAARAVAPGTVVNTASGATADVDPNSANNSATVSSVLEADVASAPPACVSGRVETLHWRTPRGSHLRAIVIMVNGKPYERLAAGARSARISLVGRSAETVAVKIIATTTGNEKETSTRVFHTCSARKTARTKASLFLKAHRGKQKRA